MDDTKPKNPASTPVQQRWLAAAAYVGPGFLLGLFSKQRSPFLIWHLQQGFAVFFLEVIAIAVVLILQETIGRIPVLGFLVEILVLLAAFVFFLVLSALGFVKALAGEEFRIPVIDDYAERVPIQDEPEADSETPSDDLP